MSKFFNCHTHIFSLDTIPEGILGPIWRPVMNLLKNAEDPKGLDILLRIMGVFGSKNKINRIRSLAHGVIRMRNQKEILLSLIKIYEDLGYPDIQFVLLCQDMDHIGIRSNNYVNAVTQMNEVGMQIMSDPRLKNRVIPFVAIDPRSTREPVDILKYFVHTFGFKGIKMYPTVGFYGDDDRLDSVYDFADQMELPIMLHYNPGVIYYRGKLPYRKDKAKFNYTKHKDYQINFLNPEYFKNILDRYEKLKLCFGHFCGALQDVTIQHLIQNVGQNPPQNPYIFFENVKYQEKPPEPEMVKMYLHLYIRQLLIDYPNAYADISFDFAKHSFKQLILAYLSDLNNTSLKSKILFGSDYFVNIYNQGFKDELELFRNFEAFFRSSGFLEDMMSINNRTFLRSKLLPQI